MTPSPPDAGFLCMTISLCSPPEAPPWGWEREGLGLTQSPGSRVHGRSRPCSLAVCGVCGQSSPGTSWELLLISQAWGRAVSVRGSGRRAGWASRITSGQGMNPSYDEYADSDEDQHDAYLERMKEEGKIREENANDSSDDSGEETGGVGRPLRWGRGWGAG